jgi:hypothetical protein
VHRNQRKISKALDEACNRLALVRLAATPGSPGVVIILMPF